MRVPKSLAFQVPHPFKQLAVRLSNIARCSLSPCSTLTGSFSFQLGINSLVLPPHLHRPGQLGRQHYHREDPAPLVDAEGQKRWIAERLLGHEDPRLETTSSELNARASIVYIGSGFHPSRMRVLFDDLSVLAVSVHMLT
uniref:Uncharacterized protein n=1 Tax=Peronospora matthiolae TaxID=2874970 RepID=A0AAV1UL49_9STRA